MEHFLGSIERQAYRMALFACHNRDDALDLVQDAMCQFVAKYADKNPEERKALFYKVLQNKIRDHYRKESVRSRWRTWFSDSDGDDDHHQLENHPAPDDKDPEELTHQQQAFKKLKMALKDIPFKQQQIVLMRAWEGLSITETAIAMGCSEGTVKSHYFRATSRLKAVLGEYWP